MEFDDKRIHIKTTSQVKFISPSELLLIFFYFHFENSRKKLDEMFLQRFLPE